MNIEIEDIKSEEYLVSIIDELMFRLKPSQYINSQLIKDFKETMNKFIERNNLDTDQHMFASLPEKKE